MEFMDAGSLEVVAGIDVPEDVLARITRCIVEGLKFLKDGLKIMHRGQFLLFGLSHFTKLATDFVLYRCQTYECATLSQWFCQVV